VRRAEAAGKAWIVDSTPWNLLLVKKLQAAIPEAVCIIMLRGWAGVCQSLARSYQQGYEWAGDSTPARLAVWLDLYRHVHDLKRWPAIAVNYDLLCESPAFVVQELRRSLRTLGVPSRGDESTFSVAHAANPGPPRTLAVRDGVNHSWQSLPAFDPDDWSPADEACATKMCAALRNTLVSRYPEAFTKGCEVVIPPQHLA
jgi:hypothetical protein